MFQKRGQVSLEVIFIYGWVFIVLLVIAGSLTYYYFSIKGSFEGRDLCLLPPGFACTNIYVGSNYNYTGGYSRQNTIDIFVSNNLGQDLDFFAIQIKKEQSSDASKCGGWFGFVVQPNVGLLYGGVITNLGNCGFGGNKCSLEFKNGETRRIYSFGTAHPIDPPLGNPYMPAVINPIVSGVSPRLWCPIPGANASINCCTYLDDVFEGLIGQSSVPGGYFTPTLSDVPACNYFCNFVSPLYSSFGTYLPSSDFKPGELFAEDLIVYYRIKGESIIHQRPGRIVATIEPTCFFNVFDPTGGCL